jgi:hypothetical protein
MVAGAGAVSEVTGRRRGDGVVGSLSAGRILALASWLALTTGYLAVFYHITVVTSGTLRLGLVVAGAFVLATLVAEYVPVRTGLIAGVGATVAGLLVYLLGTGQLGNVSLGWLAANLQYLTGVTVLSYFRVDLWVVSLAPGPVFLSWYLVLRREYDLAAVAGGALLTFFVLTGDAGETVTLLGTLGLLGLLAVGAFDDTDLTWDQLESVGLVLALSIAGARLLRVVPDGDTGSVDDPTGSGPGGSGSGSDAGGSGGDTLENALIDSGSRLDVSGSISLSPKVRFIVDADEADYWFVTAFDRYTGQGWVRTGDTTDFGDGTAAPPGATRTLEQSVTMRAPLNAAPAAWKPVDISDLDGVRLDPQGGIQPGRPLQSGESYTAVSEVPDRSPEELRRAGQSYPEDVIDRHLKLPGSTPSRVRRRTQEVIGDAPTAYDAAEAIADYLQAEKGYSLEVPLPAGDTADQFLFEMAEGYCVHFATTMAVMLRSIGIPARFAVGYATGQENEEGQYVVRGFDSHAWVEMYVFGAEWIRFDPTPGGPRIETASQRLQQARQRGAEGVDSAGTTNRTLTPAETPTMSAVEGINRSNVTAANTPITRPSVDRLAGEERALLNQSGNATAPSPANATNASQSPSGGSGGNARDRLTLIAVGLSLVLGARRLGAFDRALGAARLWYQPETDDPAADVQRAFERVEQALARSGRPRASGETPRQYLRAVAGDRYERLADLHERARYAGRVTREDADEAISIANAVVRDRLLP